MSRAACAKKGLCDPPAKAAIETADILSFQGFANDAEIYAFVACEEKFVEDMTKIAKGVVERLKREGV